MEALEKYWSKQRMPCVVGPPASFLSQRSKQDDGKFIDTRNLKFVYKYVTTLREVKPARAVLEEWKNFYYEL